MGLAPNYWQILQEGVAALNELAAEIGARVERGVAQPEELLTLRDITGLSGRLGGTTPEEWKTVWADDAFTGQDVGVLTELVAEYDAPSPYRDEPAASVRRARVKRLRALRDFLEAWDPSEYAAALKAEIAAAQDPGAGPQHRDQQQN